MFRLLTTFIIAAGTVLVGTTGETLAVEDASTASHIREGSSGATDLATKGLICDEDFSLVGVIHSEGSGSVAAIAARGRVFVLREGDTALEARVVGIAPKEIKMERHGRVFRVGSWAGGGASSSAAVSSSLIHLNGVHSEGMAATVDFRVRDYLVNERLQDVLMQAAVTPSIDQTNGELRGFRFSLIERGSIFDRIGIRDDDVVKEISGTPIRDVAATIRLLRSLRAEGEVALLLDRDGTDQTLTVKISGG